MTLLSPRLSAAWLACRFFALSFLVLCAPAADRILRD